jgi:hypothetical protein
VACVQAGVDEVGLSDTTGMANPAQVRRLFTRLRAELGERAGAAHLHNTRGLGLANCLAAFDVGVRSFDSSLGGLGGCPYAPGASGNVVTEDLVFMFEAMGVSTGVDMGKLIAAREPLKAGLPGEPVYGMTPEAGLPGLGRLIHMRLRSGSRRVHPTGIDCGRWARVASRIVNLSGGGIAMKTVWTWGAALIAVGVLAACGGDGDGYGGRGCQRLDQQGGDLVRTPDPVDRQRRGARRMRRQRLQGGPAVRGMRRGGPGRGSRVPC